MSAPFKMKGFSGFGNSALKQKSSLPEGVDEQKKILGSEAGSAGFVAGDEFGYGKEMSKTHKYEHKYDKKGDLLPGYPKWVKKKK